MRIVLMQRTEVGLTSPDHIFVDDIISPPLPRQTHKSHDRIGGGGGGGMMYQISKQS